jgi:predicted transposase YbfD/YdcC
MVGACVRRGGKTTNARRVFLSSLPFDAPLPARAHQGIENRLHRVMDVVFHDGLMRRRTDNRPRNMATIQHMANNLIRDANGKRSLKVRRAAADRDHDDLKHLITGTAP